MQTQLFAYQLFTPSEQSRQRHCDPGKTQVPFITSSAMSRPCHAAPLTPLASWVRRERHPSQTSAAIRLFREIEASSAIYYSILLSASFTFATCGPCPAPS